ncbi:MAG: type II secretion system F family protein [Candidatus Dormibacteraceae bacterium]
MTEAAAALSAGLGVLLAVLVAGAPEHHPVVPAWLTSAFTRWWSSRRRLAAEAGWPWLDGRTLFVLECCSALATAVCATALTGLIVLAVAGAACGASAVRAAVRSRARARQIIRQDAVLEATRMLRQLLETGATSVNQAIAVLAERGPVPLRGEFRLISARSIGRRQAWKDARERIGEPLFDMLAAAVLIQRPGGGELVPLFADLESSVSAAQEVEREARALQAQARSASTIIVALPVAFLVILSTLRSPYLDAFHQPAGEAFLLAMLCVMGAGYMWMRRLLDLPGLQRVRLNDA